MLLPLFLASVIYGVFAQNFGRNNQDNPCADLHDEFIPSISCQHYLQCDNGMTRLMACGGGSAWSQDDGFCSLFVKDLPFCEDPPTEGCAMIADEPDCQRFTFCDIDGNPFTLECGEGTVFDNVVRNCVNPSEVNDLQNCQI